MKNIAHVIRYLREAGWKISRSCLYRHHREGKIVPETDGSYEEKAVDYYSKTYLKKQTDKLSPVLKYLRESGWEVSKSSLYRHHREGKIRPGSDGTYLKQDIDIYARTYLYFEKPDIVQMFGWGPHAGRMRLPSAVCRICHCNIINAARARRSAGNICKECNRILEYEEFKKSYAIVDDRYIKQRLKLMGISVQEITPNIRKEARNFILLRREIKTTKREVEDGVTRARD